MEEARNIFITIADALKDVLENNTTLIESCRSRDLDYIRVRKIMLSRAFEECRLTEEPLELTESVFINPDGYEQFYMDVFELDDISTIKLSLDFRNTILDVLETFSTNEQKIIQMRYGIGNYSFRQTYNVISETLDIERGQLRIMKNRIIRGIRDSYLAKWLRLGSVQYLGEQKRIMEEVSNQKENVDQWLKEENKESAEGASNLDRNNGKIDSAAISLDGIGLSNRSRNNLKRAGMRTLLELLQSNDKDIRNIQGLGLKSYEEVCKRRDELKAVLEDGSKLKEHLESFRLEELNLSTRSFNCLKRAHKNTLLDIVLMSDDELKNINNLGVKCFDEIREKSNKEFLKLTDR